jgi:hypothetical protein
MNKGSILTGVSCAGRTIQTKWQSLILPVYYSGKYWYVTAVDKSGNRKKHKDTRKNYPIGSGKTRDSAWAEFNNQLTE